MAEPDDQNLDDFFAKKDKTKKKTAKTRITPDEIETQMEKKLKKKSSLAKKKDKDSANNAQSSVLDVKIEDDGEWKEVEVETEKDLSDLRIQNLKIIAKDEEDKDRQNNGQSGDEGDETSGRDVPQGPWKSVAAAAAAATPATSNIAPSERVPAEPEKETPKSSTGKYVPPGARRAQQTTPTVSSSGYGSRRKNIAPNVNSTDDFPSLTASASDQGDFASHDFEKVKSGGRQSEDPSNRRQEKLSLDNKYGALENMEGRDS